MRGIHHILKVKKLSLEHRLKLSESHKGDKNHNYGIPKTDEIKQKKHFRDIVNKRQSVLKYFEFNNIFLLFWNKNYIKMKFFGNTPGKSKNYFASS